MKYLISKFGWLQSFVGAAFPTRPSKPSPRNLAVVCISIFLLGTGIRLLHWQNNRMTVNKIMSGLVAGYKEEAQFLVDHDISSFLRGRSPEPDTGVLMHTPGYPILIALVHIIAGNRNAELRIFHIICGAAAAVLVVLIAGELFPLGAAMLAGALVAISPQLSFYSLVTLPDSITAIPILLAIYFIILARNQPNRLIIVAAGIAIGVSCWLRANMLSLAPFLCLPVALLIDRKRRLRYIGLMVGATVIVIAPITIRNAIVYKSFIPLALGTGQNLVEGIADYDPDKRFGMEAYDFAASRQEAILFNRPDYAQDLYRPDGILRERTRIRRAWEVIRFLGVMARRSALMLGHEEVSIISAEPSVTNRIDNGSYLAWSASPSDLLAINTARGQPLLLKEDDQVLQIATGDSRIPESFMSPPIGIQAKSDYVLRVPLRPEQGRMVIKVVRFDTGKTVASASIPDSLEPTGSSKGSLTLLQIPFVNSNADQIRVLLTSDERNTTPAIVDVGGMDLIRLGPASYLWTRYPRMLVKSAQKFFTTRWILPLACLGIALLALARRVEALTIILAVPIYYLSTHSVMHFEFRYALPLHNFWAMLVATALYFVSIKSWQLLAGKFATLR